MTSKRGNRPGTGACPLSGGLTPCKTTAEMLVGYGFRGWIAGYQTGNVECWQRVWQLYSGLIGPKSAKLAVDELAAWAKSVNAASRRDVCVSDLDASDFCRDECLAISMIAASQHNTCPAMRACAFALIDSSLLEEVLFHAESYAISMKMNNKIVSPAWIVNANDYVGQSASLAH